MSRRLLQIGSALLLLTSPPLGLLAGIAAFFGAAYLMSSAGGLAIAGAVALVLVTGILSAVATRGFIRQPRRARRWIPFFATGLTLIPYTLGMASLVFEPMEVEYIPMEAGGDVRFWELPTGSRIAYWHTAPTRLEHPSPVIFLHGGPGTPGSGSLGPLAELLAAEGFDVYHYHQVGSGLSGRLADVSEYTVARHVADLQAIREKIGAEQVILVGGSWGGTLAAHYMAMDPERVMKAIFASPGPIWGPAVAEGPGDPVPGGDGSEQAVIAEAATPRFGVVYGLTQINPRAAHDLASDEEMSGFMQPLLARIIRRDVEVRGEDGGTAVTLPEGWVPRGFGFYAMMVTNASMSSTPDPRDRLLSVDAPVLILRGEHDRLQLGVHLEYDEIFPNSTFFVVEGAAHAVSESPHFPELLRAFLTDEPLPPEAQSVRSSEVRP